MERRGAADGGQREVWGVWGIGGDPGARRQGALVPCIDAEACAEAFAEQWLVICITTDRAICATGRNAGLERGAAARYGIGGPHERY